MRPGVYDGTDRHPQHGADSKQEFKQCNCSFHISENIDCDLYTSDDEICDICETLLKKDFYNIHYDIQSGTTYSWSYDNGIEVPATRASYKAYHKRMKMKLQSARDAKIESKLQHHIVTKPKHVIKKALSRLSKPKIYASLQSGEISNAEIAALSGEAPGQNAEHVTTTFADSNIGDQQGDSSIYDEVSTLGKTDPIDLKTFLSRPVLIDNFTWLQTDLKGLYGTTKYPWHLFLNNTVIKNKLTNYAYLRGTLKLKAIINGSPFLYGYMQIAYNPLPNFSTNTIVQDAFNGYFTNYSTRPSIWIEPQSQCGGELTLPFFYPKNYVNVTSATDVQNIGAINYLIFAPLQSANGAATSGVSVQLYAWMEDVELAGPTMGLALQSGEWGTGVISKPASAVASVARKLRDVPVIGTFAKATDIGASAVSSIASLFGFTNVPNIEEHIPVHPSPFPKLAVVDSGYPVSQLTLCSKNELTVDPKTVGLEPDDELAIQNLAIRSSWLADFAWASTNNTQDNLFTCKVTPHMYNYASGTNENYLQLTPICWVSRMFSYWRGDIIFRVKLVCTSFHKGRIKISFDPMGTASDNILSGTNTSHVVYTQIVDISKDTDVEFRVPYMAATNWLRNKSTFSAGNVPYSTSLTPTFNHEQEYDNGYFNIKVLNILTGPTATASISGQVFVRAADNFEVASPQNLPVVSPYAVQSGEITFDMGHNTDTNQDKKYLVNHGEAVGSLRQILRRATYTNRYYFQSAITNALDTCTVTMTRFPLYYGYDPSGLQTVKKLSNPLASAPFNYTDVSPYCWVAPAFVGQRGSMIWNFNATSQVPIKSMRFYRLPASISTAAQSQVSANVGSQTEGVYNLWNQLSALTSGAAVQDQRLNPGLSVVMPNYTNYRFQSTNPSATSAPPNVGSVSYDGGCFDGGKLEMVFNTYNPDELAANLMVHCYSGIGPDFTFFKFLNVPTFRVYSSIPTPF